MDLRFATENEALQYLADVTGKRIKVAEKKYKLDITYETWKPEDVEIGDTDDRGYEGKDVSFDSLYDMIDFMLNQGAVSPSNSVSQSGTWYSTEGEQDMHSGETTIYSFHPQDNLTDEEENIIFNSIESGKNLATDPDEED